MYLFKQCSRGVGFFGCKKKIDMGKKIDNVELPDDPNIPLAMEDKADSENNIGEAGSLVSMAQSENELAREEPKNQVNPVKNEKVVSPSSYESYTPYRGLPKERNPFELSEKEKIELNDFYSNLPDSNNDPLSEEEGAEFTITLKRMNSGS